jgi:hypothetical protein
MRQVFFIWFNHENTHLVDSNADQTKQPISLKDAINPSMMGHIEALEWLDANKLIVRANENVEVVDFGVEPQRNYTLFDTEAFVGFFLFLYSKAALM